MKFSIKSFFILLILCALVSGFFRLPTSRLAVGGPVGLEDVIAAAKRAAATEDPDALAGCVEELHETARMAAGMKPVFTKHAPEAAGPDIQPVYLLPDSFVTLIARAFTTVDTRMSGRTVMAHFRLIRPPLA